MPPPPPPQKKPQEEEEEEGEVSSTTTTAGDDESAPQQQQTQTQTQTQATSAAETETETKTETQTEIKSKQQEQQEDVDVMGSSGSASASAAASDGSSSPPVSSSSTTSSSSSAARGRGRPKGPTAGGTGTTAAGGQTQTQNRGPGRPPKQQPQLPSGDPPRSSVTAQTEGVEGGVLLEAPEDEALDGPDTAATPATATAASASAPAAASSSPSSGGDAEMADVSAAAPATASREEDEEDEEEGGTRCACGNDVDSGKLMLGCESCGEWCHAACHGLVTADENQVPEKWYCERCSPRVIRCGCGRNHLTGQKRTGDGGEAAAAGEEDFELAARCTLCGSWQHLSCLLSDDGGGGGWKDLAQANAKASTSVGGGGGGADTPPVSGSSPAASPFGPGKRTEPVGVGGGKKDSVPGQIRLQRHYRCAECRPNQFPTPQGLANVQAHSGQHASKQATTYKQKKLAKFSFVSSSLSLRDALERDFITIFEGNKTQHFPLLSDARVAAVRRALAGADSGALSESGGGDAEADFSFADSLNGSNGGLPVHKLPENTPAARTRFRDFIAAVARDPIQANCAALNWAPAGGAAAAGADMLLARTDGEYPELAAVIRVIHANAVVCALVAKYAVFVSDTHNNSTLSAGNKGAPNLVYPTVAQREGNPDLGELLKGLTILTGRPVVLQQAQNSGKRKAGSAEPEDEARLGLKHAFLRALELMANTPVVAKVPCASTLDALAVSTSAGAGVDGSMADAGETGQDLFAPSESSNLVHPSAIQFVNTTRNALDAVIRLPFSGKDAGGPLGFPSRAALTAAPMTHVASFARGCALESAGSCCASNRCWCVRNMRECVAAATRHSGESNSCIACACPLEGDCGNHSLGQRLKHTSERPAIEVVRSQGPLALATGSEEAEDWGVRALVGASVGEPICEFAGCIVLCGGDASGFGSGLDSSLLSPLENRLVFAQVPHSTAHRQPMSDLCCVDARSSGSAARFIQRSCQPNCRLRRVFLSHPDEPDRFIPRFLVVAGPGGIKEGDILSLPHSAGWRNHMLPVECCCGLPFAGDQNVASDQLTCAVQAWFAKRRQVAQQLREELGTADLSFILGGTDPKSKAGKKPGPKKGSAKGSPGRKSLQVVPPPRRASPGGSAPQSASERGQREISALEASASAVALQSPNPETHKMTREERKIAALMRSFQKMEQREQKMQSSGGAKRPKTGSGGLSRPATSASSSATASGKVGRPPKSSAGKPKSSPARRQSSFSAVDVLRASSPANAHSDQVVSRQLSSSRSFGMSSSGMSSSSGPPPLDLMTDPMNPFAPLIAKVRQYDAAQEKLKQEHGSVAANGHMKDEPEEFAAPLYNRKAAILGDFATRQRAGISKKRSLVRTLVKVDAGYDDIFGDGDTSMSAPAEVKVETGVKVEEGANAAGGAAPSGAAEGFVLSAVQKIEGGDGDVKMED